MKKKVNILFLLAAATLLLFPVLTVAALSIQSNSQLAKAVSLLPQYPTLKHYIKLLFMTPQFFVVFWNSVKLVIAVLAGQMLIAVPAAWAFAAYRFRFRRTLFLLYIVLMLLPFQITMLSNYLVLKQLHILNTHAGIIFPAVFSAFPVFLIYRGFCGIPKEILEAARMDGAGEFFIFRKLAIPVASNGILSAMVLGFLEYWSMLEQPLAFLKDKTLWPLSLYLPEIGLPQAGSAFAASIVTLIPAVLVFLIGQDYLEKGILSSAVKA